MSTLIYILLGVFVVQSITIVHLLSKSKKEAQKTKELIINQTKIIEILEIYTKRWNNKKNNQTINLN